MGKYFNGKIPCTIEELTSLPGVGRKTANIVLANAFGIPALAVDTHVKRVSQRLGLTKNQDPDKIEDDLCKIISKRLWPDTTTLFILHGRKTCKAKNPLCPECPIKGLCDYYKKSRPKITSAYHAIFNGHAPAYLILSSPFLKGDKRGLSDVVKSTPLPVAMLCGNGNPAL